MNNIIIFILVNVGVIGTFYLLNKYLPRSPMTDEEYEHSLHKMVNEIVFEAYGKEIDKMIFSPPAEEEE